MVAHSQPVAIGARQVMVRKTVQPQAHVVNLGFNVGLDVRGQLAGSGG
jgi:hypothetical protein